MKKISSESNILLAIKKVFVLLSKQQRLEWLLIIGFALISSIFEVLTASIIVVFSGSMNNPEMGGKYLRMVGFNDHLSPSNIVACLAMICGLLYFIKNIVSALEVCFQNFSMQRMNYRFKNTLLKKYSNMDYEFYLSKNSSQGFAIFNGEIDQIFISGMIPLATMVTETVVFISLLGMILVMDFRLAIAIIGVLGIFGVILYKYLWPKFYFWGKNLQQFQVSVIQKLLHFFHGFREILLFGKQEVFIKSYQQNARKIAIMEATRVSVNNFPRLLSESLFVLVFVTAVIYMCKKYENPQKMFEVLGGYLYLGFRITPAVNRIMAQVNIFKAAIPYINRVYNAIFVKIKNNDFKNVKNFKFLKSIEFRNIYFKYLGTENYVLMNINFTIRKGENIGIIGETGAGKSTLMDLLLGLINPTKGSIVIDNKYPVTTKQWHQKIGYVSQTIYLFDDTIETNIAFGDEDIDENRLKQVLESAQLTKFVQSLPKGTKTVIGERGVRLSGGERQRIAIARALYRNPEVLIFDEATSSLDTTTESKIIDTIDKISKNYTVIMVAHRVNTLAKCDKIIRVIPDTNIELLDYKTLVMDVNAS